MANLLNTDKKIAVIGALAEGSSIRSIERMTGIHRDTIMRLGVRVGQGCTTLMDAKMANIAYAWAHETDDPANPIRHVTVLKVPPAVSPETAVRVAISQELRNAEATEA